MSSSSAPLSTPEGPGSVSGSPNLPAGFTDTYTSRSIDGGELRQHAVINNRAENSHQSMRKHEPVMQRFEVVGLSRVR